MEYFRAGDPYCSNDGPVDFAHWWLSWNISELIERVEDYTTSEQMLNANNCQLSYLLTSVCWSDITKQTPELASCLMLINI